MRRLLAVASLALLISAADARELDLDGIVAKVGQRTVRRLLKLAKEADQSDLRATARRCYEAIRELDPENAYALAKLGYRRQQGGWHLDPKLAKEVEALEDPDKELARVRATQLAELLDGHTREVIRVCVKYGSLEQRARILEPFLARQPRRADLHEALEHVRVGDNYARPGLVETVRLLALRRGAWHRLAVEPFSTTRSPSAFEVPGTDERVDLYRAGRCEVATTLENGAEVAESVGRAQSLLRTLLGDEAGFWSPSPVLFLKPAHYTALLRKLQPDKNAFEFYQRYGNYEHGNFYAIRVWQVADAAERYAHTAGFMSMFLLAAPPSRKTPDQRDTYAYAWLLEGFGYLVSLELFDRAHVSFVSIEESSKKRPDVRPPPKRRTRAACLDWLRAELQAGRTYPLREVVSFSLNNLDFLASMEAYSFLRFLFLHDPAAGKKLPAALRRQTEGPPHERVERALRETFGKGIYELEALWRAFELEIDQGD